ncbi:tetratricopeptide repeat protein [Actinacidiphila bryophytorum]|uniref:tetratricopeptide repeat protein n=1 Tax=Actinacidiphila bryophytorum TaxID=1436133 RepID=UPI002176A39E|nr:hypothetical protein [Actinacidiphila bryophytorum]UWE13466.1 hypothetical protein NYE86_35560 [Actinacidiphila bryophytorum]
MSTIESYGRDARDFITLEESRKIQSIDGPRASAEYIRSRIGRNWSSGLVGAYLALLENSGQQREIEDILPHLRGVCVRSPSAAHAVASIFDDREEYAEAARHEKEALRLDPNNPEYAWYVASYLDTLEAHDEAHRYYALAYSLDPGDVDRTESYIVSLLEHSDFSRAAQVALEFPSSDSKYAEVRSFAGVAFALQGEFSKAEDVLKSISGTSGRAVRALAQVMMAQGKVDDAADLLISRWQSHSESATALLCVEVLRQTGSLDAVEDVMAGLAEHLEREERRFAQFAARTVAGQQSSRSGDA